MRLGNAAGWACLLAVPVVLALGGCEGGDESSDVPRIQVNEPFSISGTWQVTDAGDPGTVFIMEIAQTGRTGAEIEGVFYIQGDAARFRVEGFFVLDPWPDAQFRVYNGDDHLFTLSADTVEATYMEGTYSTGRHWSAVKL